MSILEIAEGPAPPRPIGSFRPSATQYRWDPTKRQLVHGYDRDLQLFVIWPDARPHESRITDMIAACFRIIARFELHWSDERRENDFERLYATGVGVGSGKVADAGVGTAVLVIVEDTEPTYQYCRNVSGFLEPTNVRMSRVKRAARELAGGYTVHSSNSLGEFFRDATLMLGPRRLDDLLLQAPTAQPGPVEEIHDDLIGANGWADLDELAAVLRRTTEYLVLRNYEQLPGILASDPEIDILARDQLDFAAIANGAAVDPVSGAGFTTTVAGRNVTLDVRWVGDGYLDPRWQDRMLERRIMPEAGLAHPRIDDYFFSLLYHAKIQKPEVKPGYVARLRELAEELALPADLAPRISDDDAAAAALDGYLAAHGFAVPQPRDQDVHRNAEFTARLTMTSVEAGTEQVLRAYLWNRARNSRVGSWAAESDRLRALMRRIRRLRSTRGVPA